MQYFIFPFILLAYFELFGRYILLKFNKDAYEFSFVIGLSSVMGILFLTIWPITAFNLSFNVLLITLVLMFLASVILIIKDIKKIDFKFDYRYWLMFIIFMGIQIYISSTKTLGEVHGFDTINYLNMIGFNIENPELNSLHMHFGTTPNDVYKVITYVFQSYYYFIPVVIYIFRLLFSIVNISFETMPAFVWGFQILMNAIYIGSVLICIKKLKHKNMLLNISLIVLLIFFLNNLYYNNVLGFIGNNYRMSIHAISTIILFDYFKTFKTKDLILFILMQLGIAGLSSTGSFAIIFVLFGLFFYLYDKEKNLLKIYALALFIPLLNILATKFLLEWWVILLSFIICLAVFLLNDVLLKIFSDKKIRYGSLILLSIGLIIVSCLLAYQHNIMPWHFFIHNYSEIADMSWDYFMFNDLRHWIFNIFVLIPLFYFIYKNKKHGFTIIFLVLALTFFNPFASVLMNQLNWVYYRAYDLLINQYTIALFIIFLYDSLTNKVVKQLLVITLLICSIYLAVVQIPSYYHESFKPDEDYNVLFKMDQSELEAIYSVRAMIEDYNIENPHIMTSTFYMPTFIENSTYLFGKEKRYDNNNKEEASFALYLILFPVDFIYDNFRPDIEPDYQNTIKYLNETHYNILVVEHGLYYTDPTTDESFPITSLIEEDGTYVKSEYSTARYAIYYLNK